MCVWLGGRVVLSRRLSRPVQQGKGLGEMAFEIPSDCLFLLPLSSALGLGSVSMTTLSQGGQLLLMKGRVISCQGSCCLFGGHRKEGDVTCG